MIEGPNGKKYRRNAGSSEAFVSHGSSFQDHPKAKENILTRRDNVDSFQDPRPTPGNDYVPGLDDSCPIFNYTAEASKTSKPKSHPSHRVHSPQSPSSSPPAQLSPREHLVSPAREDHTAPKQHKIIRPQDVDRQPTPGLAALAQVTSPLAPYKIQCSTKRRARQMLSNMR